MSRKEGCKRFAYSPRHTSCTTQAACITEYFPFRLQPFYGAAGGIGGTIGTRW